MMTALDYANIAQLAYTETPFIGKSSDAGRAIKQATADGIVFSFPGSDNFECWRRDFDAFTRNVFGMGNVHEGIYKAWLSISEAVVDSVGPDPVTLCGHSLGGALAIFAGAYLCLLGKPPRAIWAFEPPRVSIDSTIAQLFIDNNIETHITRHGNDEVPELPPALEQPWQHPGPLWQFGKPAWPFPNIEDHLMENIIKSLKNIN